MRPKSLLLLVLALGCGLVASIGISQVMDKNNQGGAPAGEMEAIYIAKVDINLGDPIKTEMVNLEEWPKDKIPTGAIRELTELEDRRPRAKIFAGEPLMDGKLLNPGEHVDPTITIPPGYRVLPISVKADTGVAGLLNPGDRVDVQWFVPRNQSLGIEKTTMMTLLQNIRVFAIDQMTVRSPDGEESPTLAKTVSLLVTPVQANKLRMADNVGTLSLVARHPDDAIIEDSSEIDYEFLFTGREGNDRKKEQGGVETVKKDKGPGFISSIFSGMKATAAAAAAAEARKPPFIMQVIEGDEMSEKRFSPSTGRLLTETEEENYSDVSFVPPPAGTTPTSNAGTTSTEEKSGGNENDFPIDLDEE